MENLVGQHYVAWLEEKGFSDWEQYYLAPTGTMDPSIEYTWGIPEEYHYNTFIAEKTNDLLESYHNQEENFFLWASFPDSHPPYLVPEPWTSIYDPDQLTIPEMVPGEHDRNPPHFKFHLWSKKFQL